LHVVFDLNFYDNYYYLSGIPLLTVFLYGNPAELLWCERNNIPSINKTVVVQISY
jgi:hypothetical protein